MQRGRRIPTEVVQVVAIFALATALLLGFNGFDLSQSSAWGVILLSSGLVGALTARITGRIRDARDRQRTTLERYQAFIATSSEAIWRIELRQPMPTHLAPEAQVDWLFEHGYHAECNDKFLEIYGFSSEAEVVGRPLAAIFQRNPNNEGLLRDFVREGYRAENVVSQDLNRDGEIVDIKNSAVGIVEEGYLWRVWGTQMDVTEQRRAALELERSERLLADAERIADIGSWGFEVEGEGAIHWSKNLFEMCRLDPGDFELEVTRIEAGIHPDDRAAWRRLLARAAQGLSGAQEVRVFCGDGDTRHHWIQAEGVVEDGEGRRWVLGISRDVTRVREAEAARRQLELEVQQLQKLEALGTLAGGIAHDFNNILSASMGYTDLALQEVMDQGLASERYLREVERANDRARDLVGQILSFSRRVERQRECVELDSVVEEAASLMRASLPPSIDLRTEIRAQEANLLADGSQIHQVMINLCTNAAQAMPEGGRLQVELDREVLEESRSTTTGELLPDAYFRLSVTDTGIGMTPETLTRIFDPFFTTKKPGEGTGLGLSTVHGIVLNHRGGIDVRSQPGEGTRFVVYLPCDGGDASAPDCQATALAAGRKQTVMLVDDERALVVLGHRMLERLDYRVVAFHRADQALSALRDDPKGYDLVVTDYRMPEMSGLEMVDQLRQFGATMPVVIVTGYTQPELEQAKEAGKIQGLLLKPFNLAALGDCVANALSSENVEAEARRLKRGA